PGDRVDYAPYQQVASRFPEIPPERFAAAVQLIEPDGGRAQAAEAVFRFLACAPGRRWPLWLYRHFPGFAAASEWCYRLVARHRTLVTRITRCLSGEHALPPGHTLTGWLVLRPLGPASLNAFVSLWTQIIGLVG